MSKRTEAPTSNTRAKKKMRPKPSPLVRLREIIQRYANSPDNIDPWDSDKVISLCKKDRSLSCFKVDIWAGTNDAGKDWYTPLARVSPSPLGRPGDYHSLLRGVPMAPRITPAPLPIYPLITAFDYQPTIETGVIAFLVSREVVCAPDEHGLFLPIKFLLRRVQRESCLQDIKAVFDAAYDVCRFPNTVQAQDAILRLAYELDYDHFLPGVMDYLTCKCFDATTLLMGNGYHCPLQCITPVLVKLAPKLVEINVAAMVGARAKLDGMDAWRRANVLKTLVIKMKFASINMPRDVVILLLVSEREGDFSSRQLGNALAGTIRRNKVVCVESWPKRPGPDAIVA